MSKKVVLWIIAAITAAVGIIIFVITMTALSWDFSRLSTIEFETSAYDITDSFDDVRILVNTSDVTVLPAEDGKTSVVVYEHTKVRHEVSVEDGSLKISFVDTRSWYDFIGFSFTSPSVTVYLPEERLGMLTVKGSTGKVEIAKDVAFNAIGVSVTTGDVQCFASASNIDLKTTTGDVYLSGASANILSISSTTGDITAQELSVKGSLNATVSTGAASLSDVECGSFAFTGGTGDITMTRLISNGALSCVLSTGDVIFDHSDAEEIAVTTSTGDVTGTLLSSKYFITHLTTGLKRVPETTEGGFCEITVTTGNIFIDVVN